MFSQYVTPFPLLPEVSICTEIFLSDRKSKYLCTNIQKLTTNPHISFFHSICNVKNTPNANVHCFIKKKRVEYQLKCVRRLYHC